MAYGEPLDLGSAGGFRTGESTASASVGRIERPGPRLWTGVGCYRILEECG